MRLNLRAHHLLCLQGFQGYGYSEDFIKNMAKINELRKDRQTTFKILNTPDDICKFCPNLKNNKCLDENKIRKMDNEILSKINIEDKNLFNQITNTFNSKKSVENICGNCIWHEKCLFYINLKD